MKFDIPSFVSKLVAFESVSADSTKAGATKACAEFLKDSLETLGFKAKLCQTALNPIVFASRDCANRKPKARVLFYGHYDVQPADPLEKWSWKPFEMSIADGRMRGRGTADNKGPFTCVLAGVANFLAENPDAPIDIAFMIEGEEEIGSPSMAKFIADNKELISSYDFVALSDTSGATETLRVITTGLRGTISFDVKFKGANTDVHSGMFGGVLYNPLQAMFEVCASLHDADGFVNVPHFYDGIAELPEWERAEIAKRPIATEDTKSMLGVKEFYSQKGWTPDEAVRVLPTLEFTGVGGGYQGEGSKSIIPSECFCKVSCRSAAGQDIKKMAEEACKAIAERCPRAIEVEFENYDSAGEAYWVNPKNPDSPVMRRAFEIMENVVETSFGEKPIWLREGASIPLISTIKRETGLDSLMLGLFTAGDNLHAPNESFSIALAERAASCYEKFLQELSK